MHRYFIADSMSERRIVMLSYTKSTENDTQIAINALNNQNNRNEQNSYLFTTILNEQNRLLFTII